MGNGVSCRSWAFPKIFLKFLKSKVKLRRKATGQIFVLGHDAGRWRTGRGGDGGGNGGGDGGDGGRVTRAHSS